LKKEEIELKERIPEIKEAKEVIIELDDSYLTSTPKRRYVIQEKHLNSNYENILRTIARKRLAKKLNNPRLMQIHFHTLRHWKGTTLYHQTKDVVYVKQFLGHRVINNTMLYIQLEKALFDPSADQFTCKIARTEEEIKQLIEAGFEYVTQNCGLAYFRKRK